MVFHIGANTETCSTTWRVRGEIGTDVCKLNAAIYTNINAPFLIDLSIYRLRLAQNKCYGTYNKCVFEQGIKHGYLFCFHLG